MKNWVWLVVAGVVIYLLWKSRQKAAPEHPKGLPEEFLGLGATGIPRRGKPKSEYERMLTHYSRFGTTKVPPRGTGLK